MNENFTSIFFSNVACGKLIQQILSLEIVPSKNKRVFHDDQAHIQDPKD